MTGLPLRVAVDIGGTFTDLVVHDAATGRTFEAKTATTPAAFATGVLDAIRLSGIDPAAVADLIHGTTVVINAITQRAGVKTALVTTAGYRDALAIGRGNRPDMYNLRFKKPVPFVPRSLRFEVPERVNFKGEVLTPLDLAALDAVAAACRERDVAAVAICFLHSYAFPAHERAARDRLAALLPGVSIAISSDITQEWREFERSSTVVLNAYVQPTLDVYLAELERELDTLGATGRRFAMLSNGGTATFASARGQPIQLVESGPAGGVIGAALLGERIGQPNILSLDIGGTTAKCSLIEDGEVKISGDYRLEWTPLLPGYPVRVPVVDIVEIGAGGGSIAWFDEGGALRVGPRSAGAEPGPACYGAGGTEPTVTDAMLIAGVLAPGSLLGGRLPLNEGLAHAAYAPIAARLGVPVETAAAGVIRLVNEATIDALKLISVRRGHDPRDFALVAFGGGGPMHAALLAPELGVKSVVIPPFPGTFSAHGMLLTKPRIDLVRTRVTRLVDGIEDEIEARFAELEREAERRFVEQGFTPDRLDDHQRAVDARYAGQEHTVRVPVPRGALTVAELTERFHALHQRSYTFALVGTPVEIVHFRTISSIELPRPALGRADPRGPGRDNAVTRSPSRHRSVDFGDGVRRPTAVFRRADLPAGFAAAGPAIVEEPSATVVVPPGQRVEIDDLGNLVIRPSPSPG